MRVEGVRLERTTSSPSSIAKEILSRPEEMEQQRGGNWTLEDIKGALIDDMKAMMQDELRQALAGLIPPPAPAAANPPAAIAAPPANPPIVDAPPANNDNAGGNL